MQFQTHRYFQLVVSDIVCCLSIWIIYAHRVPPLPPHTHRGTTYTLALNLLRNVCQSASRRRLTRPDVTATIYMYSLYNRKRSFSIHLLSTYHSNGLYLYSFVCVWSSSGTSTKGDWVGEQERGCQDKGPLFPLPPSH